VNTGAPGKSTELASKGDTAAVLRQPRAENIRDVHEGVGFADRANRRHGVSHLAGGAHEFGVGVADVGSREGAPSELGDHRRPRQAIVDMTSGRAGFAGWHTKHHIPIVEGVTNRVTNRTVELCTPPRFARRAAGQDQHTATATHQRTEE